MATEAFEMYRQSEIGYALTETLDEMVSSGVLSPDLAITVLLQFDKVPSLPLAAPAINLTICSMSCNKLHACRMF